MKMKKCGLVLEGGAARGIYTAGVLDVFAQNGIRADGVMGVSAGAIHGLNYVSGQCGRSYCFTVKYCADRRFMSFSSLLRTGDLCGADFCYYEIPERLVPFAQEAFAQSKTRYYCVCTDVRTGQPVYHECPTVQGNEIEWVRASASMPLVSRTVETDGMLLLDGGVSDSVPLRKMQALGYEKNIVICTRHEGYRKTKDAAAALMPLRYAGYPAFVKAMQDRAEMYNRQMDDLKKAEENGEAFVIRPSSPLTIGRMEHDPAVIREVYLLGRSDAEKQLDAVRNYIY